MRDPRTNYRITGDIQPARIGHYAIDASSGEGGMGVVYAARDDGSSARSR